MTTPAIAVLSAAKERTTFVVESDRYEQWMKMATDNKINSSNTWNTALIDYFADMSLLRNNDYAKSINFQKASCTLDGCVKIWTSRVDSVGVETTRLLSGLANDPRGGNDLEEEGENEDEEDDQGRPIAKAKKSSRQAATLADTFAKIKLKSLDLEFTVDPLFKKTSADFDEGGAGGILMNHLGCDSGMRVVFDAGDAKVTDDEDVVEGEEVEAEEEEGLRVDISRLKLKFLPPLELLAKMTLCPSLSAFKFNPDATLDLNILNPIDEEEDALLLAQQQARLDAPAPAPNGDISLGSIGGGGDDGFVFDDFGGGGDDNGGGAGEVDFFDMDPDAHPHAHASASEFGQDGENAGGDELIISMDQRGASGPGMGMDLLEIGALGGKNWAGPEHWKMRRAVVGKKDESTPKTREKKLPFLIDFFTPLGTVPVPSPSSKTTTTTKPIALPTQKELFLPAPTSASIQNRPLSASTSTSARRKSSRASSAGGRAGSAGGDEEEELGEGGEEWTLPVDLGFTANVLLRLFLKPKLFFGIRNRHNQGNQSGDVDEQFWANGGVVIGTHQLPGSAGNGNGGAEGGWGGANEDYGGGGEGDNMFGDFGGGGNDDNDDDNAEPIWDTQFLHSNDLEDEIPEYDDLGNRLPPSALDPTLDSTLGGLGSPGGGEEEDLLAATQGQLRRVKVENVNYAKRAKRVDVKRLKDAIWKELEGVVVRVEELPTAASFVPVPLPRSTPSPSSPTSPSTTLASTAANNTTARVEKEAFTSVITNLRKIYPKEKMEEISTSFCFICLLHLANEKGLRIQSPAPFVGGGGGGPGWDGGEASGGLGGKRREEGLEERRFVGGLDQLRVFREISAV